VFPPPQANAFFWGPSSVFVSHFTHTCLYFAQIFLSRSEFIKLKGAKILLSKIKQCRSQWSLDLRHRSAAARLLRSWVRIPLGAWMFVCCECPVLSGRGLCDELITRPEDYRLQCVVVCDLETLRIRRPWPALGRSATEKKNSHSGYYLCCDLQNSQYFVFRLVFAE